MYKTLYTREYQQMLALLRAKRTDAQVSQVELARRLEWTQADVSKCETGVRRLDVIELRIWLKALGYELSGLMTQDAALRAALTVAGEQSGDEVWSLPLDSRLKKQTESAIADLCNTPGNNAAISASAAWLLHHFCPPEIPWAHLDVSGTALWREGGRSVASGRPIPLLMEHLMGDI